MSMNEDQMIHALWLYYRVLRDASVSALDDDDSATDGSAQPKHFWEQMLGVHHWDPPPK